MSTTNEKLTDAINGVFDPEAIERMVNAKDNISSIASQAKEDFAMSFAEVKSKGVEAAHTIKEKGSEIADTVVTAIDDTSYPKAILTACAATVLAKSFSKKMVNKKKRGE